MSDDQPTRPGQPEHLAFPRGIGSISAILASRRNSVRCLLVVVDAATNAIDVKLFDTELELHGVGRCVLQLSERGAATALARVTLERSAGSSDATPPEVNLAISWALVREGAALALDVAGTAFVFDSHEARPEEFQARRRDPFNSFPLPEPGGPEVTAGAGSGEAPLSPALRRWRVRSRLAFPPVRRLGHRWPQTRSSGPQARRVAVPSR